MIETVNDPICSYYKLANGFIGKLRHNPSSLGKGRQAFGVSNQQAAKAQGLAGAVDGDVSDNIFYVDSCRT